MMLTPKRASWRCLECGYTIWGGEVPNHNHTCGPELAKQVGIDSFESDLEEWLTTADGRFAVYLARRQSKGNQDETMDH